jgi:hypothetical protein
MGERGKRGKRKRTTRGFRSIPYLPRGRIEVIGFCGGSCDGSSVHLFCTTQYCFCVCVLQGVRAGLWGSGTRAGGAPGGVHRQGEERTRQGRRRPVASDDSTRGCVAAMERTGAGAAGGKAGQARWREGRRATLLVAARQQETLVQSGHGDGSSRDAGLLQLW